MSRQRGSLTVSVKSAVRWAMSLLAVFAIIDAIVMKRSPDVQRPFDFHWQSGASLGMCSKRLFFSILLILCTCLAPLAGGSVHGGLLATGGMGLFPIDSPIGPLEDPASPSHPAVEAAYLAFDDVYHPEWYTLHVHPEVRFPFNRLQNKRLATVLPASVAIGKPRVDSTQVYLPLYLLGWDGKFQRWDSIFVGDGKGRWYLVSLSEQ